MTWSSDPAFDCLEAARQFGRIGVQLPDMADQWVQRLIKLQASRPEAPAHNAVAELIADAAKESEINAELTRHVNHPLRAVQHAEAERVCGQRALAAILADQHRMHQKLAAAADPLIERLHAAALIDEDLRQLVLQGRSDEAHMLSVIDADAAELRELYALRDEFLTSPTEQWSTGRWDCAAFENPWDIPHFGLSTGGDEGLWATWRRSIRAGGRLWFPSLFDAHAASAAHEPTDVPSIDPRRETAMRFV